MRTPEERKALIQRVLQDPPPVHSTSATGVWSTSTSAYELMAEHCGPGSRTLETGLGVSTVLFAGWGTEHTCVVHRQQEVYHVRKHMDRLGIADGHVQFHVGSSDIVLPNLDLADVDLVLIDGSHAFPLPIIDWYYAAGALKRGGVLVLDDTHMEAVRLGLTTFLAKDPRWATIAKTLKWRAYRRLSQGPLSDVQEEQGFLGAGTLSRMDRLVPRALHPSAKAVARRLRIL
jgi:hypothetical protein